MIKKLMNEFINPGSEYRPIPFWSWNYKLENEKLCHQVRMMNDVGVGRYFMHACGALNYMRSH